MHDPDTEAVVLAKELDWAGVAAVLDIDPAELSDFTTPGGGA